MASTTSTSRRRAGRRAAWLLLGLVGTSPVLAADGSESGGDSHSAQPAVVLRADRLVSGPDGVLAEGASLRIDGALIEAARVRIHPDGAVEAWGGRWQGPAASATFEALWISADTSQVELFGAELRPCACDGPEPWGLRAARVQIVERGARTRGGQLLAFGHPILPLPPVSIPTARRSGLLPPVVQGGQDGLVLATPLYLTLGEPADLTLTPEVRTLRGGRLTTEGRYALPTGGGVATVDLATDAIRGKARAAAQLDHAQARDDRRLAAALAMTSDPFFWQDYAPTRLARLLPATTSRALIGSRHVEVSAFGAATGPRDGAAVAHAIAGAPWTALPHGMVGRALGAVTGTGRLVDGLPSVRARAVLDAGLERPTWLGPIRWTPALEGQSSAVLDARATLAAALSSELALPLWATGAAGLTRIEPHLSARVTAGEALAGADLQVPDPTQLAGGLRARRTVAGAGVIELVGQAAWTAGGITPVASGRIEGRAGRVQGVWRPRGADPFAWIDVHLDPGPVATTARIVHRPGIPGSPTLAGGEVLARPGPLELGVGADADLQRRAFVSRRAWLGWTHRSGCLGLAIWARLDEDRAAPDVALSLTARPKTPP